MKVFSLLIDINSNSLYCKRNKLNVLGVFKDNGESSYTFGRPDYKALEAYLKKYKGECQYLIVLDHDRFSRNLPEALMKIAELEKKHGVKVLSTSERVELDTSDPDVFMKRALDYMMSNKELFNIRKRTKQGVRNAKQTAGIWVVHHSAIEISLMEPSAI